ncbi:FHA domain-containing protein [Candidatus Nanopelagicales bacterium]|nr:FHA domain-containing protein [Candidatus Nanopelagicales bacterium]
MDDRRDKAESPAEQTANIQLVRCDSCGHIAEPESKFCSSCGASLISETAVLSPTVDESGPVSTVDPTVLAGIPAGDGVLVVQRGRDEGTRIALNGEVVTVGRSPDAGVFLDDVTVSRRHADISADGGRWTLTDNNSLNGTYVNRERIDNRALEDGDEVQIGKYRFNFYQSPQS